MANADCRFTYRHSRLQGHRPLRRLDVLFQLIPGDLSQPVALRGPCPQLGVEVGGRVPLADAREAVLAQRRRRGMVLDAADHDTWSCGSFFTNPILSATDFAAWRRGSRRAWARLPAPPRFAGRRRARQDQRGLADRAGRVPKGFGLPGPAALSTKHTLAVTNRGDATASEVAALARQVRDGVHDAFGVTLVNEPVLVGHSL